MRLQGQLKTYLNTASPNKKMRELKAPYAVAVPWQTAAKIPILQM